MDFRLPKQPKICAVVRGGKGSCTSMSYHDSGNHLFVTSEADSRMRIVDCQRGVSDSPAIKFERDGVSLVQATHHEQCVLITGKGDKTLNVGQRYPISYLSLHDNKILRQFRGCGAEVIDLSLNPVDDSFLSCSKDRTVRLWNLQQPSTLAILDLPKAGNGYTLDPNGVPHASYDSTGLVFCITAPLDDGAGHLIHLYDARKYSTGAFAELKVDNALIMRALQQKVPTSEIASDLSNAEWNSIKFNTSGKHLLVSSKKASAYMLDGYDGSVVNVFVGSGEKLKDPMPVCFSSDDKTVLGGNSNGTISCWDANDGELIKTLEGHVGRVTCIASNPKFAQIASSCTNTALWLW